MSEEIGEVSQEIVTLATQEAPQGELPSTPESAPEPNTPADTAAQPDEDHKVPKGVQKRIDRLTRERYRLQGELEAERRRNTPQPPTQTAAGEPKSEQFASYEAYLEAKAEWKAEQKVAEVMSRQAADTKRQTAQAEHAQMQKQWESRVDAALEIYDDFEEVALAPDVPISESMMQAILRTEKGADVAYYLGKHRAEAEKIARMDPFAQAVAIGRIEATLARPTPKKTTNAPAPISPVGARAAVSRDPSQMTDAEFAAWRREQIKRRN